MKGPIELRLWSKVDRSGGPEACWPWLGSRDDRGYGYVRHEGRPQPAYRVAYELTIGPVPAGLELDHLCRNTSCCNPGHLEAVTHAENVRRGEGGAFWRAKTHCPAGHPYDSANTMRWADGGRHCRACHNARTRAYKAQRRAA